MQITLKHFVRFYRVLFSKPLTFNNVKLETLLIKYKLKHTIVNLNRVNSV